MTWVLLLLGCGPSLPTNSYYRVYDVRRSCVHRPALDFDPAYWDGWRRSACRDGHGEETSLTLYNGDCLTFERWCGPDEAYDERALEDPMLDATPEQEEFCRQVSGLVEPRCPG